MVSECLKQVKLVRPRVHCITNSVTANDCANVLLACGASPILADDPHEAAEITAHCAGLCLNLGTLSERKAAALLASGTEANARGVPVVFDPVGVGASAFRRETAKRLLETVRCSVMRGNVSEIRALALGTGDASGVDAEPSGADDTMEEWTKLAKTLSKGTGAVIVLTGAKDVVTDGETVLVLKNGHPMMRRITGTGCQLSALTAAFAAANSENIFEAAVAAACAFGLAGELAARRMTALDGSGSYRNYLIDGIFCLTEQALKEGARIEVQEGTDAALRRD